MVAALKDIITAIAAITVLAYATGQQKWLWKQIAILRREALIESQKDWGCPSIFNLRACHTRFRKN
jgi:hypothetical protein